VGHNHHFLFGQKLLDAQGHVGRGIAMVQEPIPLCHFSGLFIEGSQVIVSTHSSKSDALLLVLEEPSPCALSHHLKKKKSETEREKSTLS
jgi:hypothetical protein